MNLCTGKRSGYQLLCNGALYKCQCGHVGCTQSKEDTCSNQGFSIGGKCVKCGAIGKFELVSPEAAAPAISLMQNARATTGA